MNLPRRTYVWTSAPCVIHAPQLEPFGRSFLCRWLSMALLERAEMSRSRAQALRIALESYVLVVTSVSANSCSIYRIAVIQTVFGRKGE